MSNVKVEAKFSIWNFVDTLCSYDVKCVPHRKTITKASTATDYAVLTVMATGYDNRERVQKKLYGLVTA